MKKRIIFIVLILLITTGCTCEYNLTINDNVYQEEITLTGENQSEINSFNKEWKIPIDKNEYNVGTDPSTDSKVFDNVYDYKLTGNSLKLNYDFNRISYMNSSAVSNCYQTLSVLNESNKIFISTSKKTTCFDKYPTLNRVTIKIHTDKEVISSNADNSSNNTYTWIIYRENANNKPINMVINNENKGNSTTSSSSNNSNNIERNNLSNYMLYIFIVIMIIIIFIGYKIFIKMKQNSDNMDD